MAASAVADAFTLSRVDERNQPKPLKHFARTPFYSVGEADLGRLVSLDDVPDAHGVSPVGKKLFFILRGRSKIEPVTSAGCRAGGVRGGNPRPSVLGAETVLFDARGEDQGDRRKRWAARLAGAGKRTGR
jgi:hypothetical protein